MRCEIKGVAFQTIDDNGEFYLADGIDLMVIKHGWKKSAIIVFGSLLVTSVLVLLVRLGYLPVF